MSATFQFDSKHTELPSQNVPLANITRTRLEQFRRRRLQLAVCRGLSLVAILFVAILLVAVACDALFVNERARWLGSIALYGLSLLGLGWLCVWPISRRSQLADEARRFEAREPRLREQLLSAVELSESHSAMATDSAAFRQQLQTQVAERLQTIDVRHALPWRLIRRTVLTVSALAFGLLLLCLVPTLHFPERMARVLLPAVDLGRVSSIKLTIERPQPRSGNVPRGDILSIAARVVGTPPESLRLETRTETGVLSTSMVAVAADQSSQTATRNSVFESMISVDSEWMEYRVVGAGASTPWYRLTAMPRPRVVEFEKRVTLPDYARTESRKFVHDHGNLLVLRGSRVELQLTVDQPVAVAELRWESESVSAGEADSVTRLQQVEPSGRLITSFVVERSSAYKVYLQAQETGFINAFSPSFTITAIEDLPPRLAWLVPTVSSLVASAEQILSLEIQIDDELPVDTLTGQVRVNAGPWQPAPLSAPKTIAPDSSPGFPRWQGQSIWQLDLLPLGLKPGDYVDLKLSAKDRMGQETETSQVQVMISSTSIALVASESESLRQAVAQRLEDLAQQTANIDQALQEAVGKAENGQDVEPEAVGQLVRDMSSLLRAQSAEILPLVEQAIPVAEDTVSGQELLGVGTLLASTQTDTVRQLDIAVQGIGDGDGEERVKHLQDLRRLAGQSHQRVDEMSKHFRAMVSHDVLRRHADQISLLAGAQADMAAFAEDDQQSLDQLNRQRNVLTRQMKEVQQSILDSMDGVREETQRRLQQSSDQFSRFIDQAERNERVDDRGEMQRLARELQSNLQQLRLMSSLDGNLPTAVQNGQRRMDELNSSIAEPLNKLAAAWQPGQSNPPQATDAVEWLSFRRSLQRATGSNQRSFASDLGSAQRALEMLIEEQGSRFEEPQKAVRAIGKSIGTLEAINTVAAAKQLLRDLLRDEQWSMDSSRVLTDSPRAWDAYARRMEQAAKQLRAMGVPQEIVAQLEQLRWNQSAQQASRNITARRWQREPPLSAATHLQQLSQGLDNVEQQLSETAREARQQLSQYAPKISELASRAAKETSQVEQQTEQLAEAIDRQEVPDVATRLGQLDRDVKQLADPMQTLREALVDRADAQDLLDARQLDTSRHADAAIEVVDRAAEKVAQSLQDVMPVAPAENQTAELAQAAEDQAESAAALQQLAEHFEQAEQQTNDELSAEQLAAQRLDLSRLSEQLANDDRSSTSAISAANREGYDQAAQLAQMAATNPQQMLQQLEQELQSNQPMQGEMSQIARQAAEQALEGLDQAARDEQQIVPALEASDPVFKAQKELLLQDLKNTREAASKILANLLSESKWTAGAGREPDQEKAISQIEEQLRSAIDQSGRASTELPFEEMHALAAGWSQGLQRLASQMTTAGDTLNAASAAEIHQNGADLNNRRREMRDRQRRIQQQTVRSAQQAERVQQQRLRQADNELRQTEQRLKRNESQLLDAQKQLNKRPNEPSLKNQIVERERQVAMSQNEVAASQKLRDALEQRTITAKATLEHFNQQLQSPLNSVNPTAELSAALAQQAGEFGSELADKLKDWATRTTAEVQASASQLQNSTSQQANLQVAVQQSASDLARAARHEGRLDNQSFSGRLDQLATSTAAVAEQPVEAAKQSLSAAASQAVHSDSPTAQANPSATQAAQDAVGAAAQAIQASADALRTVLAAGDEPSPSSASGMASAAQSESPLSAREKAQLLDELDRQLQGDLNLGAKEDNSAAPNEGGPSDNTPSTLSDAAQQLAKSMSRSREPTPPASANSDVGMATESQMANVDPQGPTAVRMLDIERIDGQWGELREQAAEDLVETRREVVIPQFRKQVEAYFRALAERGRQSNASDD